MRGSILVVDDHEAIRTVLREMLADDDLDIREAGDGESALAAARERVPDVVFLDLSMPGMDGLAVLRRLKADERTSAVRVVLITAHGAEGREEGLSLGAEEYFEKPFSPLELLRLVERMLPPREGDPPAAEAAGDDAPDDFPLRS